MASNRPYNETVRNLLVNSDPAASERTCYLYRHFAVAASGLHTDEYTLGVPFGDNRFGAYVFTRYGSTAAIANILWRMGEATPAVFASVSTATLTGTWVTVNPDAEAWASTYSRSNVAGDTAVKSVSGHTLFLRLGLNSNAGFGLVAIDGDYTAATLLPAVTQTEVTAGWFVAGDIGKRYIDCYKGTGAFDRDDVVALVEGLTDAAHTVTVQVKGTKRTAATDTRVYITAFGATRQGTKPNDSNATLAIVRHVCRPLNSLSSIVNVPEYTPTGFSNYQFLGEGHGNESAVSDGFLVNGVVTAAPTAGTYLTGAEISYDRITQYDHPNATACATRRVTHTGSILTAMQLTNSVSTRWATAGTIRNAYAAMLPTFKTDGAAANTATMFNGLRLGDALVTYPTANDDGASGKIRADVAALYSSTHDMVAVCHLPRVDLAVNGWASSSPDYCYFSDRSDGIDKVYFVRSNTTNTEAIAVGATKAWANAYRIFRVLNAATRLAE